MSDLIEWLIAKENRISCQFLGCYFLVLPVAYFLYEKGDPGLMQIIVSIQALFGLLFFFIGFGNRESDKVERKCGKKRNLMKNNKQGKGSPKMFSSESPDESPFNPNLNEDDARSILDQWLSTKSKEKNNSEDKD